MSAVTGRVTAAVFLSGCLLVSHHAIAAPCLSAGDVCGRWVALSRGTERLLVYGTHDLRVKDAGVRRAIILVHGGDRAAEAYFRLGIAASLNAGALDSTVVLAPRFGSTSEGCRDRLAANEVDWDCGADGAGGWRSGEAARGSAVTSFDAADALLLALNDGRLFPNLEDVVLAGFSGGGQFVQRYAAASRIHGTMRASVRYVVVSPSSYFYPDADRPVNTIGCPLRERWPYGIQELRGYAGTVGGEHLRTQLLARDVVYMVGALDGPEAPSLERSCAAVSQGASRLERAQEYFKVVTRAGARHRLIVVSQCGHHAACMFIGREPRAVLFGPAATSR